MTLVWLQSDVVHSGPQNSQCVSSDIYITVHPTSAPKDCWDCDINISWRTGFPCKDYNNFLIVIKQVFRRYKYNTLSPCVFINSFQIFVFPFHLLRPVCILSIGIRGIVFPSLVSINYVCFGATAADRVNGTQRIKNTPGPSAAMLACHLLEVNQEPSAGAWASGDHVHDANIRQTAPDSSRLEKTSRRHTVTQSCDSDTAKNKADILKVQ